MYICALMLGRRISSLILSTVFLPVFLVVSFHHHGAFSEAGCEGCSQSIPHSHLDEGTDACLVCQFLSALWLTSQEAEPCSPVPEGTSLEEALVIGLYGTVVDSPSTRAPPVFFC